jgi:hypothetical protein
MRAMLLVLGFLAPSLLEAQERWQRLPGAAKAYQVDLQSLTPSDGVLQARIQRSDLGNVVLVEEIEIRCSTQETRTLARSTIANDTGRPLASSEPQEPDSLWISYPPGSEGHAILAGLCALGHERKLLGTTADLDV